MHVVAIVERQSEALSRLSIPISWQFDVLLDNIRSAWNVGAILRTADGTGIHKIYFCGITPTPDNIKVKKTALCAEENILWEKSNNGIKTAGDLRSEGCMIWVLEDLPKAVPLFQVEMPAANTPIVLVVGNELSGVDPGIFALADKVISIPMLGKKQSYNVAIAFSIAASFLLYRQSVSHESRKIFPNT
jgi:tRNA G18 (ribose-2'-O)-methylase SpoU